VTKRFLSDEIRTAAERLIELTGGKGAAKRAIDAAEKKGRAGRPKGSSPYAQADAELLFLVESFQNEFRFGALREQNEPKPRTLIAEAFDTHNWFFEPSPLGNSKRAVVERVASQSSLASIILQGIRQNRSDLMQLLPEDAEARLRSIEDDPTKPNFAMVLTVLALAWGFARRDPKRFAELIANDPAAGDSGIILTNANPDATPGLSEKKGGD